MHLHVAGIVKDTRERRDHKSNLGLLYLLKLLKPLKPLEFQEDRMMLTMDMDVWEVWGARGAFAEHHRRPWMMRAIGTSNGLFLIFLWFKLFGLFRRARFPLLVLLVCHFLHFPSVHRLFNVSIYLTKLIAWLTFLRMSLTEYGELVELIIPKQEILKTRNL